MTVRRFDIHAHAAVVVQAYRAGWSLKRLARKHRTNQHAITDCLRLVDEPMRTRSESGLIRASRESRALKARRVAAWRAYAIGRPLSFDQLRKRTETKARKQLHIGQYERRVLRALKRRGIKAIPQAAAVNRYNVDLAIGPFAVEIHVTRHHPDTRAAVRQRVKDLRNHRWHVLYVWHAAPSAWWGAFDAEVVCDQIVAFMNETGLDPAAPRQYKVITSDGHDPTRRRTKLGERVGRPAPRNDRHADA